MQQKDDHQFEAFKASLAKFLQNMAGLVDRVLADETAKGHLVPLVPWVSEVMSASMERDFVEKVALAYWSRMGMTETSTPARLKIMEMDGLSEALRMDHDTSGPAGAPMTPVQQHLLEVCSFTIGSLLDAIGDMFPLVRGILRSTQDAIDVARS